MHIVDQNVLKIECFVMERFDLTGNLVFLQSFSVVYLWSNTEITVKGQLSYEYVMLTFSCVGGKNSKILRNVQFHHWLALNDDSSFLP